MISTNQALDASIAIVSMAVSLHEIHRRELVDRQFVRDAVNIRDCRATWLLIGALREAGESGRAMGLLTQILDFGPLGSWAQAYAAADGYARETWDALVEGIQS